MGRDWSPDDREPESSGPSRAGGSTPPPSREDDWRALTERGARAVTRGRDELAIGPSHMRWEGGSFVIDFDERSAPLGARVAGTVRIHPEEMGGETVHLDAAGRHRWTPIAPLARAEVELRHARIENLDMDAMTMVFEVADPRLLDGLKPGDTVRFAADKVKGQLTVTAIEPLR